MNYPTAHASALALMDEYGSDGLYGVYRSVYKYTACGPTVGFLVRYTVENDNGESGPGGTSDYEVEDWIYCDDLARPLENTPYRLNRNCLDHSSDWGDPPVEILGASVGSIVEGIDRCADTIYLEGEAFTVEAFNQAIEDVDNQVDQIWNETHGCDECSRLNGHVGLWGETTEGYDGATPVHADCPKCNGEGEAF